MKKIIIPFLILLVIMFNCKTVPKDDHGDIVSMQYAPDESKGCDNFVDRARALCLVQLLKQSEELKNSVPRLTIRKETNDNVITEYHRMCWYNEDTKLESKCTTWPEYVYEPTFMERLKSYGIVATISFIMGYMAKVALFVPFL